MKNEPQQDPKTEAQTPPQSTTAVAATNQRKASRKKSTNNNANKGKPNGTIGYLKVMPLSKPKLNESREVQSKARSSYNDEYDRVSSHYTENYKAEQVGCKQGTKFTFTEKYADEELGFSAKYQTQFLSNIVCV
ncbi:hypothetical protein DVH24_041949 [Malus domestica]|uniref:Uncharacterized protein n=1 Tax=Malus domestica TaxID=3750 RepID=A0A498IUU2_MALDO|nr:hypothetical protein DVH24_041949 [Malus domestica]